MNQAQEPDAPHTIGIGTGIPGRMGLRDGPQGIGGWLIFPALHLVIAFFYLAIVVAGALLTNGAVGNIRLAIIVLGSALVLYTLYCMTRFFRMKQGVPGLMIGFYCLTSLFHLVLINPLGLIANVIWIVYFVRSQRVKETFVN